MRIKLFLLNFHKDHSVPRSNKRYFLIQIYGEPFITASHSLSSVTLFQIYVLKDGQHLMLFLTFSRNGEKYFTLSEKCCHHWGLEDWRVSRNTELIWKGIEGAYAPHLHGNQKASESLLNWKWVLEAGRSPKWNLYKKERGIQRGR